MIEIISVLSRLILPVAYRSMMRCEADSKGREISWNPACAITSNNSWSATSRPDCGRHIWTMLMPFRSFSFRPLPMTPRMICSARFFLASRESSSMNTYSTSSDCRTSNSCMTRGIDFTRSSRRLPVNEPTSSLEIWQNMHLNGQPREVIRLPYRMRSRPWMPPPLGRAMSQYLSSGAISQAGNGSSSRSCMTDVEEVQRMVPSRRNATPGTAEKSREPRRNCAPTATMLHSASDRNTRSAPACRNQFAMCRALVPPTITSLSGYAALMAVTVSAAGGACAVYRLVNPITSKSRTAARIAASAMPMRARPSGNCSTR